MFCKECGHEILENAAFCSNCGVSVQDKTADTVNEEPLAATQITYDNVNVAYDNTNIEEEAWRALIQKNSEHYIPAFRKFKNGGIINWNWSAFLFGIYWMLYRKAYIASFILIYIIGFSTTMALPIVANNAPALFEHFEILSSLILSVAMGLFGDFIYYKHVKRMMKKAQRKPDKTIFYAKKGGTNWFGPVIPFVVGILFYILFGFVFYMALS